MPRGRAILTRRGNAAHSNEMVVSAAADFNSLCCHPPTSRKARQATLTTPTGNLPSERCLSRRLQWLQDLSGAEKCHPVPVLRGRVPVHVARSPRQPTAAPGALLGGESKSKVRVSRCCNSVFTRKGDGSWPATHYTLEERLKTAVQPSRTFCEIVPIPFNC